MPNPAGTAETYSLLVLNVNFRTTVDDLFPLFEKYGKVVDIFIPRDRRTGESRGFAFVRYFYKDEAQKAVDRLDGRVVDGREIAVQFAKYGPHSERIHEGRIIEKFPRGRGRSKSRSPSRSRISASCGMPSLLTGDNGYRDDHYGDRDYRRRNRSRSLDRYERERYHERERDYQYRDRSYSGSPAYDRGRGRRQYDDERRRVICNTVRCNCKKGLQGIISFCGCVADLLNFTMLEKKEMKGQGGQMMIWLLRLFVISRGLIFILMLIVSTSDSSHMDVTNSLGNIVFDKWVLKVDLVAVMIVRLADVEFFSSPSNSVLSDVTYLKELSSVNPDTD
ncbi:hypothetical protein DH2020_030805 [Rehmannia glutinosa]|uniref:RRM domain-containing protein n=1 Tax=Rehmannia glutinosa TaxID=99300 RepID=A0ABR0VM87_REHGL